MNSNTVPDDSGEQKIRRRYYKMSRLTCRTCLFEHKNLTSIFATETSLGVAYSEMISSIAGIEILENDGLTEYLCGVCKQNARVAYQYKLQTIKSDRTLRDATDDSKPSFKVKSVTVKTRATDDENYEKTDKSKVEEKIKIEVKTKIKRKCKTDAKIKIKKIEKDFDEIEEKSKVVPIKSEFVEYNDDGYDDRIPSPLGDDSQDYFDDFVKEEPKISEVPLTSLPCETCGDVFESLSSFQRHTMVCTKLEHVEKRINYCPVCGESFDNALALLQHARTHNRLMSAVRANRSHNTTAKSASMKPPSTTKILTVRKKKKLSQTSRVKKRTEENAVMDKQELGAGAEVEHVQDVPDHPRCGICSGVFDTRERLDNHFVTHSGTPVMWCALCDKLFLEPVYLRRHLRTAHRQEDVACSDKMSDVRTTLIGDLVAQRKETSADSLYLFVCPQCGQLTLSVEDLLNHNATEHPEFCHRCNQCFKLFCDPDKVPSHRRVCVPSERFVCPVCQQKFVREQVLQRHMQSKHRPDSGRDELLQHVCYICGKQFSKFEALNKHKYRSHAQKKDGQKIYECNICHAKVKDKNYLAKHISLHGPHAVRLVSTSLCRYCGKLCRDNGTLVIHIRRHHTLDKPYKCDYCDRAFPRSTDKVSHERTHTGVKPYPCQVCGMRFIKSSSRTRHMRVHTGERPYKCTHCDHAFSQSQDLKKHERRHTGEKAHACETCGESFSHAKEYRAHRATCNRDANSPALMSDPHLALIKSQMEYARTYSQLT